MGIKYFVLPFTLRRGLDGGLWLGPLENDSSLLELGLELRSLLGTLEKYESKSSSVEDGDWGNQELYNH